MKQHKSSKVFQVIEGKREFSTPAKPGESLPLIQTDEWGGLYKTRPCEIRKPVSLGVPTRLSGGRRAVLPGCVCPPTEYPGVQDWGCLPARLFASVPGT